MPVRELPRLLTIALGPGEMWVCSVMKARSVMIQSFGSGASFDQYHAGVIALEGTNWSWAEAGLADEAAWTAGLSRLWLPVEIPSGTPWEFDGSPARLACLLTQFPRFLRFREKGTLAAGHTINLSLKSELRGQAL